MLVRFSVAMAGGNEALVYEPKQLNEQFQKVVDSDLFSGFMEALQLFSEEMGAPIKELKLADLIVYVQTYRDFTIRLILSERLPEFELEHYFDTCATEVMKILPMLQTGQVLRGGDGQGSEIMEKHFWPILSPLIEEPPDVVPIQRDFDDYQMSKIALCGLAEAGKTSMMNLFFQQMPLHAARATNPTLGVNISRKFVDFLEEKLMLQDLGGQEFLRAQHLTKNNLWYDLSALIYVVDLQDPKFFTEALEYLNKVWATVTELNPRPPRLAIFLHKYDPEVRVKLTENVATALRVFQQYSSIATFHLTSLLDHSSSKAMIKALYFSMPDIMIKRLLEEEFLEHFEKDVMPQFSKLVSDDSQPLPTGLQQEIRNSSIMFGRSYGMSLQESWFKYLAGEFSPKPRKLTAISMRVERQGPTMRIVIPRKKNHPNLSKIILDGMLEGIARSLYLVSPTIVDEDDTFITWRVGVTETGLPA